MAQDIRIRLARSDERTVLEALQWRASLTNAGDRQVLLAHPDAVDLPREQVESGRVLVAEAEESIAGFAVLLPRDDGQAELDGLFVEPELFGRGVGRALVEAAARLARDEGARRLHVIGHVQAEAFYRSCGFETVGEARTRFGPALALLRRL